jgi:protein-disulfide isomerase
MGLFRKAAPAFARATILLSGATLLLAAAPPAWDKTVRQGVNGAYVMGNPAAKTKLVEYLSYTCGHCAHFVTESKVALKTGYVARGTVSVEVRNAVRDRFDFTAALLARCGGPGRFFGNTEAIMAAQQAWLGKAGAFEQANGEKLGTLSPNEGLKLVARGVGLDAIMKARGFTPQQIDACLVSKPDQDRVLAMTEEAWNVRKLPGTPSFLVNGQLAANATSWAALESRLKAARAAN